MQLIHSLGQNSEKNALQSTWLMPKGNEFFESSNCSIFLPILHKLGGEKFPVFSIDSMLNFEDKKHLENYYNMSTASEEYLNSAIDYMNKKYDVSS